MHGGVGKVEEEWLIALLFQPVHGFVGERCSNLIVCEWLVDSAGCAVLPIAADGDRHAGKAAQYAIVFDEGVRSRPGIRSHAEEIVEADVQRTWPEFSGPVVDAGRSYTEVPLAES